LEMRQLQDPRRKQKLHRAYERILEFYHLKDLSWVTTQTIPEWITSQNHNFKRLTRIIQSLRIAGLERDAQDLFQRLKHIYTYRPDVRTIIDETGSFSFWEDAAATMDDEEDLGRRSSLEPEGRGWRCGILEDRRWA
jgi:hypothetical protein